MYIQTPYAKYLADVDYYSKSGNTYTLLVAGTDYTIGNSITSTVYNKFEYDILYIRPYGSNNAYQEFPYQIDGVNTLPEYDGTTNDVDLDAFTNTEGHTVRNRVAQDVATLEFNVPTMSGNELHSLYQMTKDAWLDCYYFSESDWVFASKKMYRNASVKYHKYYIDKTNPDKNIYTNVNWGFVEE